MRSRMFVWAALVIAVAGGAITTSPAQARAVVGVSIGVAPPPLRIAHLQNGKHDERHEELADDVGVAVRLRDHAGREPAERAADDRGGAIADEMAGQHVVPGVRGAGQTDSRHHEKGDPRAEQQCHRNERNRPPQGGRIRHQIETEGCVELFGEERVVTVREDAGGV